MTRGVRPSSSPSSRHYNLSYPSSQSPVSFGMFVAVRTSTVVYGSGWCVCGGAHRNGSFERRSGVRSRKTPVWDESVCTVSGTEQGPWGPTGSLSMARVHDAPRRDG